MATEKTLSASAYTALLIDAVTQSNKADALLNRGMHAAVNDILSSKSVNRINELSKHWQGIGPYSMIHKSLIVLTGGSFLTGGAKPRRFYDESLSILNWDKKSKIWTLAKGIAPEKWDRLRIEYQDWKGAAYKDCQCPEPPALLSMSPIIKYAEKLRKNRELWNPVERKEIKAFLALIDRENVDTDMIPAAQTSGMDGKPHAPHNAPA